MRGVLGRVPFFAWLLFFAGASTAVAVVVKPETAKYAAVGAGIIAMLGSLLIAARR